VDTAVATVLTGFLAGKRAALAAMAPELLPVADELAALCATGPGPGAVAVATAWAAGRGTPGAEPEGAVLQVAAAVEVLRVADLAHREVMAAAGTRGVDVPGRVRVPLVAEDVVLGADAGILVGDLALVWSEELLGGAGLSPAGLARVSAVWDAMRTALTARRYLQLLAAAGGAGPTGPTTEGTTTEDTTTEGTAPVATDATGWARRLGAALAGTPAG
jgi:geranylgeranyl diphosphate synthase, type I